MKKLATIAVIIVAVAAAFIFAANPVSADDDNASPAFAAFPSTTGEVVDLIEYEGVVSFFVIEAGSSVIWVAYDEISTMFLGDFPEIGDVITYFIDGMAPMILPYPPRHNALAIVNHNAITDATFLAMGRFDEDYVSSDNLWRLNIGEDTEFFLQDGQEFQFEIGRLLLVEYTLSHRDIYPTTIFPTTVHVLFERAVHLPEFIDLFPDDEYVGIEPLPDFVDIVDIVPLPDTVYDLPGDAVGVTGPGAFDVNIDFSQYAVIVNNSGVAGGAVFTEGDSIFPTHVALRPVLQYLGITPRWENRVVSFTSPEGAVVININIQTVTLNGQAVELPGSPIIIEGRTYVPLRFWVLAFGFNNSYFEGGHVRINNFEVME